MSETTTYCNTVFVMDDGGAKWWLSAESESAARRMLMEHEGLSESDLEHAVFRPIHPSETIRVILDRHDVDGHESFPMATTFYAEVKVGCYTVLPPQVISSTEY